MVEKAWNYFSKRVDLSRKISPRGLSLSGKPTVGHRAAMMASSDSSTNSASSRSASSPRGAGGGQSSKANASTSAACAKASSNVSHDAGEIGEGAAAARGGGFVDEGDAGIPRKPVRYLVFSFCSCIMMVARLWSVPDEHASAEDIFANRPRSRHR
jgi:hypothetical protein